MHGVFAAIFCFASAAPAHGLIGSAVSPSQWPATSQVAPQMEGFPNAIRYHGPDRYGTSFASLLALRGNGSFPFNSPDSSSGAAPTLAQASGWWGLGRCPKSVILIASDSPADAFAASALSDSTGRSTEPYLRRSASSDPLFYPVGGFSHVDTDFAPLLITGSARSGHTMLSTSTRLGIQDLRSGGCSAAREAIIVGGPAAVPSSIDDELVSLGIREVFRVQGANRFATASAVALSLGTAPIPDGIRSCVDPSVRDGDARMTYYANSVIEYRPSAYECRLLGSTVVLADGLTGADAIAAGWWTSYWQVPVLLHDGTEDLPAETKRTLQTMNISNLMVLGGHSRISDAVVRQAQELTGADTERIAGLDRYGTSVLMAQYLGGWWPTRRGKDFSSSMICVAASSGSTVGGTGWPDALSAGPWCGAATGSSASPPSRLLPPITADNSAISRAEIRAHDAVPIILVRALGGELPGSVENFLRSSFTPADSWCSSVAAPPGCVTAGFAVVFGGERAVADGVVNSISRLLSGGSYISEPPYVEESELFITRMEMSPVYRSSGQGETRVCASRSSYGGVRWLAVGLGDDPGLRAAVDIAVNGWYRADADGIDRSPGIGTPGCVALDAYGAQQLWMRALTPSGRIGLEWHQSTTEHQWVALTTPVEAFGPLIASGQLSDSDSSQGGSTSVRFLSSGEMPVALANNQLARITTATITIEISRGIDDSLTRPDQFSANWSFESRLGSVYGSASGEAIFSGDQWSLRGKSAISGGTWAENPGFGGFSADLFVGRPGFNDDSILWQVDGVVGP